MSIELNTVVFWYNTNALDSASTFLATKPPHHRRFFGSDVYVSIKVVQYIYDHHWPPLASFGFSKSIKAPLIRCFFGVEVMVCYSLMEQESLTLDVKPKKKAVKTSVKRSKPKTKAVVKMGRPSKYTPALADRFCAYISEGKSMRNACLMDGMPERQTIFTWFRTRPDFLDQYTRSKEASADVLADEIQDIAEKVLIGVYDPQAARVAGDLMKWAASKLKPKKYGDKLDVTSGGEKLPAPITNLQINAVNTKDEIEKPYIDGEVS